MRKESQVASLLVPHVTASPNMVIRDIWKLETPIVIVTEIIVFIFSLGMVER